MVLLPSFDLKKLVRKRSTWLHTIGLFSICSELPLIQTLGTRPLGNISPWKRVVHFREVSLTTFLPWSLDYLLLNCFKIWFIVLSGFSCSNRSTYSSHKLSALQHTWKFKIIQLSFTVTKQLHQLQIVFRRKSYFSIGLFEDTPQKYNLLK